MMRNLIKKILKESDFDWIKQTPEAPNYNGHPQGVVYLRSHNEISEFLKLLKDYNGGWLGPYNSGYDDFYEVFDDILTYSESVDPNEEPILSVSFFVKKPYPNKLISGYWEHPVDNGDVEDYIYLDSNVINKTNWKIYDNLSDVKLIFKQLVKESEDFDWIKDTNPNVWDRNTWYFMDISGLNFRPGPWSMSSYTELSIIDIIDKMGELGYDNDFIPHENAKYLYFQPNTEGIGEKDYLLDYSINEIRDIDMYIEITPEEWEDMIKNYEIKMGLTESEFDWITEYPPQDPLIFALNDTSKQYKVWFGSISREQQKKIIKKLNKLDLDGFGKQKNGLDPYFSFDSLYFKNDPIEAIGQRDDKWRYSPMYCLLNGGKEKDEEYEPGGSLWKCDKDGKSYGNGLKYNRNFFEGSNAIELSPHLFF